MALTLTLLTPVLAFLGAGLGVALNRRGARELERRSVREETMRNVRWAAELATETDVARAGLGVEQLAALDDLSLDTYERRLVKAALATINPSQRAAEEE